MRKFYQIMPSTNCKTVVSLSKIVYYAMLKRQSVMI